MPGSDKVVFGSKGSRLRWGILASIVVFAMGADYLLKRDIREQVRSAWLEACVQALPRATCEARARSHHSECFAPAYRSMMFTFGRDRWESFNLMDYEACMNRPTPPPTSAALARD